MSKDGSAPYVTDPLPVNGENSPSTSSIPASPGPVPSGRVGADRVGALALQHPQQLYRFENVGLVAAAVGAMHIELTTEQGKMTVDLPDGRWVILSVGAIEALQREGFVTYDKPEAWVK